MRKSEARVQAKDKGEKYYIPETPCIRNHLMRRTSDGSCIECRRIQGAIWVSLNRDAYNARKRKERQHKLPQLALKAKQNRLIEPLEKAKIRKEQARIRAAEWRVNNPNHANTKICKQLYKKANPDKTQADTIKRRVSKINRSPKWLSDNELWMMKEAYALAILRPQLTGIKWHVDHIIPLQGKVVSGLHVPTNLQVIPAIENIKKGNKFEVEA